MKSRSTARLVERVFRIERHRLGPRCYLLGKRVHEVWLGIGLLVALAAGAGAGMVHEGYAAGIAAAAGAWMIAKDWRDLFPSRRDTASWQLGLHRKALPWRPVRHLEALPLLSAVAAAVTASVNVASALTADVRWRQHLLLRSLPGLPLPVLHALALPAAAALLVAALYLAKRRHRAWQLAFGLLVLLGALNLLKGLDYEEAGLSFALAAVLWVGRSSFDVHHEPVSFSSVLWRLPAVVIGSVVAVVAAIGIAAPGSASVSKILRESGDLMLWHHGPILFNDELSRLPLAIELITALTALWIVYLFFRPLAAPRSLPDPEIRLLAAALVRVHGADTLAYFKLRKDKQLLFSADQKAFLGYRVQASKLVISGDPVGEETSFEPLLKEAALFAARRGLKLAAIGASEPLLPLYENLGLKSFYLGDEAIVDTASFSLDGRAIRKVRQSVSRLAKEGYTTEIVAVGDIASQLDEIEAVGELSRRGRPERGFSMAIDTLRDDEYRDTLLLIARNREQQVRGFLHFVPSYGRSAMSLSMMRRHPETPNGLTEMMIVEAILGLRQQGIEELSLNFAAFARFLNTPVGCKERVLGWLLRRANPYFQLESLYRFNSKFFPRWKPRYLVYEGTLGLPRTALAIAWLEGQLPRPRELARFSRKG